MNYHRLDNPERIEELNPLDTLKRIGFCDGQSFCDIGAGTGIFTFAAAEISTKDIYAVDISDVMREVLRTRNRYENVKILDSICNVPNQSCHTALLCSVLHEIDNMPDMAKEIERILTDDGILIVIEFHKKETVMGPPMEMRLSAKDTTGMLVRNGFVKQDQFVLGDNFYCVTFRKAG